MSYRLRGPLGELGERLRALFPARRQKGARMPRLRGRMRRVIVVPTPDALFSEAIFILRDEVLRRPGMSQDELLREAARAAESCTEELLPPREGYALHPLAAFLLGSAATLLVLWATGLL